MVQEIKEAAQFLRETGAIWINERKKAVQNGEDVPMDILTQILKSAGNFNLCTLTHTHINICMYIYMYVCICMYIHKYRIQTLCSVCCIVHLEGLGLVSSTCIFVYFIAPLCSLLKVPGR